MSGKKLPKINVVYAVDGAWGIGGQAMTNDGMDSSRSLCGIMVPS
jgi:hypothetical protein